MVLPDPSWRVKTRPCPFYQQGRCMFSESCNFLHTASSQVDREAKGVQEVSGSRSPHNPPRVVINSPPSVCSSPRSPRTTGLLLALGDVVADPNPDENGERAEVGLSSVESDVWEESLPTLVNDLGFGQYSQPNDETAEEQHFVSYEDSDIDSDGNWTAISDYDEDNTALQPPQEFMAESTDEPVHTSLTSPRQEMRRQNWVPSPDHEAADFSNRHSLASTSSLLSPIEVSTLRLGPFFQLHRSSERESNSFDSGYADTWKPPAPLLSSPPRSPSVSSTFDLLSSPFGVHSSRISSPHLTAFMPRTPVSPARTVFPHDTDDIEPLDLDLDSPKGQDDQTAYLTPLGSPSALSQAEGLEDLDSSSDDEQMSDSNDSAREDALELNGHTSVWDSEGGDTAVYMGNVHEDSVQRDVESAVSHINTTPIDFLNATIEFQVGEEAAHSSIPEIENSSLLNDADDDDASTSVEALSTSFDDDTAYLAYLKSPLVAESNENDTTENDTLDSLYSSYSALSFDRSPPSEPSNLVQVPSSPGRPTPSAQSNSSTPLSSLRERVFTPPPPNRKRSGTITADSPNSSSSPITSIDSSMGRQSPFSDKNIGQRPRSQSPYGQEVEVSRKIPIGFRSTFALGRANRSSLITSRNNGKNSTLSPLQTHPVVPALGLWENSQDSDSPTSASSLPKGLKPLRLSTIIDAKYPSRPNNHSRMHSSSSNSVHSFHSGNINRKSASSTSVTSTNSLSDNRLLSSTRSPPLPLHVRNSLIPSEHSPTSPSSHLPKSLTNLDDPPQSAPVASWRRSVNYSRPSSRLSEPIHELEDDDFDDDTARFSRDPYGETIRRPIPDAPLTAPVSHASSLQHPIYTIETPKPTLMFAIASDNVEQVRQVLASGEAGPNESVGPQSALEFTLRNDKLTNKLEIVKALLAYGADPAAATKAEVSAAAHSPSQEDEERPRSLMQEIDPATRYYLERADSIHTKRMSVLIHRSFFRPLTRVRYDLIGQDRALEQLFRVLSMHSRELAVSPMVVMLCGPSGHGKSLLARKFGSLLEVPTHTVNMTTLRSTHNLWESHSMSPYETPTTCTLAEFLTNNEGKRCVVVLDEIEKTEDPKTLWSLLMPWELGRCAFEAGKRHVDVKNVIWLGTSNVGHDLVFQHRDARKDREGVMSREEYVELMALLRPKVSERLGASILSRITTVLPFVPFTLEEKRAICSEALYTLGGELARTLAPETIQTVTESALAGYCEDEGARSLHRAISNKLVDII
ncbi:hypothetical protein HYPSUDRAFT_63248 [Hypholoma sublateritium FD-334 SS-4]|uniref:C3H1-type domain-containing protein n=1 Tax=Hypholoma sublateritium (strain FD-334 SS-4) TaxID=945553 RepID=A0A0D2P7N4_HYPSF|nr:hypothetical protein HYPSUDRAFT_63248 [Hypholoma sublateritium FD-334 SS-4]